MNIPVEVGIGLIEAAGKPHTEAGHVTFLARLLDGDYTIWEDSDVIHATPFFYAPANLVIMPMAKPTLPPGEYDYMTFVNWWWDEADALAPFQVKKEFWKVFLKKWLDVFWNDDTIALGVFKGFFMPYARDYKCPQSLAFMDGSLAEFPSFWYKLLKLPLVPGQDDEEDLLMTELAGEIAFVMETFCDSTEHKEMEETVEWLDAALADNTVDADTKAMYWLELVMVEGALHAYDCNGNCSYQLGFGVCML